MEDVIQGKTEVKEISGYAIYAPQQRERTVVNNLPEFYPELPVEVLHNIEKMFPTQRKIELFARHQPKGWTVWGLDVRPVYKEQNNSEPPKC